MVKPQLRREMSTFVRFAGTILLFLLCSALGSCKNACNMGNMELGKSDGMQIDYLARHPEWIPIIAEWSYSAWHKYDPTLTVERSLRSINKRLNTDQIPLTLVAIHNNRPIATASLKESVPVSNVPGNKVWLGSLYVEPNYRNKGIGSKMLKSIYNEAIRLGQNEIYLFSSDSQMPNWYAMHGWEVVNKLPYQDHIVTIMRIQFFG
jgi:N-acetylglutamate synthase-like GNAT family acetyltransferase